MIKLNRVSKIYKSEGEEVKALTDISLELPKCGLVCVVGESGCGKTTLLNLMGGFIKPTDGNIFIGGENTTGFDDDMWDEYRNAHMGFVFQNFNMLDELTVEDNVKLPLEVQAIAEEKKNKMVVSALKSVGLQDKINQKTKNLSGGEKQRVAIARALIKKPKLILADEPTGNLDSKNSDGIFQLLKEVSRERLVVVVTHDGIRAEEYSDQMILVVDGQIREIKKQVEPKAIEEYKSNKHSIINMRLSSLISISKKLLAKRKVRAVVTSISLICSIFLLLIAGVFLTYNVDLVVSKYMEKHEIYVTPIYSQSDKTGEHIGTSEQLYEELLKVYDKDEICLYKQSDISTNNGIIDYEKFQQTGEVNLGVNTPVNFFCVPASLLKSQFEITGMSQNEIVISKDVALELNISESYIGKKLYVESKEMILKDILDIDEGKYVLASTGFVQGIYEKEINDFVNIAGVNVFENSLFGYIYNSLTMTGKGLQKELVIGRYPIRENEIVISEEMAILYNIDSTRVEEEKCLYNVRNLSKEGGNEDLSKYMNLYCLIGDEVKVVGIANMEADVMLCESVYITLLEKYCEIYYFDNFAINSIAWENDVEDLHHTGFRFAEESLIEAYSWYDTITEFKIAIWAVVLILILLNVMMFISLISYSVKDNSRLIGILRSMGVKWADIRKLIGVEPIIMLVVSLFVGTIGSLFGIGMINSYVAKDMHIKVYDIIVADIRFYTVAIIIICTIGILSVLIPLKNMDKKEIIELTKE